MSIFGTLKTYMRSEYTKYVRNKMKEADWLNVFHKSLSKIAIQLLGLFFDDGKLAFDKSRLDKLLLQLTHQMIHIGRKLDIDALKEFYIKGTNAAMSASDRQSCFSSHKELDDLAVRAIRAS